MAVVYVSSTQKDLLQEREKACHALRMLHFDVIAMEDYVAADTRPLDKCLADVAGSDIYVGIFGWRYGYVPPGQERSITELEYREAIKKGKKCLIFLQEEVLKPAPDDPRDRQLIENLRAELRGDTLVSVFSSPEELAKLVAIAVRNHDVASANTGIRLLKNLITRSPAVADSVSRSKEGLENTYRQVSKLELFKKIHEALHAIEFACLRPLQAGGTTSRLRPFKIAFEAEMSQIQAHIKGREINRTLHDDIEDQLKLTSAAFQGTADAAGDATYRSVVCALDELISALPTRLDAGIADAAAGLNLGRLVQIMTTVRGKLDESASEHDPELEPFIQGIEALGRLSDEVERRVTEHTQLQRLDLELRRVCLGGNLSPAVSGDWDRVKRVRARLAPPFSPELEAANPDLVATECEIEAAVERSEAQAALDLLKEYFMSVGSVFKVVDTNLKAFCLRLSEVNRSLKTVLDMC